MIKDDFTQVLLGQIVSDVNMHNVYLQHGQSGYCAFLFFGYLKKLKMKTTKPLLKKCF